MYFIPSFYELSNMLLNTNLPRVFITRTVMPQRYQHGLNQCNILCHNLSTTKKTQEDTFVDISQSCCITTNGT